MSGSFLEITIYKTRKPSILGSHTLDLVGRLLSLFSLPVTQVKSDQEYLTSISCQL